MDIVLKVLAGLGTLLGLLILAYGVYALVKREVYVFSKRPDGSDKVTGKAAIRYSLYYIVAGGLWVVYSVFRLVDGLT
jgi:hypothetical protein